jgi:hypothetical protein
MMWFDFEPEETTSMEAIIAKLQEDLDRLRAMLAAGVKLGAFNHLIRGDLTDYVELFTTDPTVAKKFGLEEVGWEEVDWECPPEAGGPTSST